MDSKAQEHFSEGKRKLQEANRELYKPMEDVVSFVVCRNTLSAIENYLKGYLELRGFETKSGESIEELMERCRSLNKKFREINIETIDCRATNPENKYCEEVNKVNSCFNTADHLDSFLRMNKIL